MFISLACWCMLNVTEKLFWFWLTPGLAHLGGGGGGVFTVCATVWFSATMFLISGSTGEFVDDRLLMFAIFWWKLEVDVLTDMNLLFLIKSTMTTDLGVSIPFLVAFISCTGLNILPSTLWIIGDGHRTLCTRFGEISFCESFSLDVIRSCRSFFISNGSLKVVRFKVFGGVGRGWRGNDDTNVVMVFVGDEVSVSVKINSIDYIFGSTFIGKADFISANLLQKTIILYINRVLFDI